MRSQFEKFDMELISRNDIHGADYNPRTISPEAKKRLREMLAKHGLVMPLVWNKRTGNLVAGHQRLLALDTLEGSSDYSLNVAVVDLDEREEKVMNVQLNNPSIQGDWDMDKLLSLVDGSDIDPFEFGFSEADVAVMFGNLDECFEDIEEVKETKKKLKDIKEERQDATERFAEEANANFYFTVVCRSDEQKRKLMDFFGVPEYEQFVSGLDVESAITGLAQKLGSEENIFAQKNGEFDSPFDEEKNEDDEEEQGEVQSPFTDFQP